FTIYGARPLGLAGSYTAIAEDTLAGYWNPAGLYSQKGFDLQLLSAGLGLNFTGNILQNANNIGELASKFSAIDQAQREGKPIDITQISALTVAMKNLKEISEPRKGMLINVNGGIGLRLGKYVFSVSNYTDIGVKPYTDFDFWLGTGSAGISFEDISTSTEPPTGLIAERDELSNVLGWLIPELQEAGVSIPTTITTEQLANALINLAVSAGATQSDIQNAIKTISENETLIKDLLQPGGNSFKDNQSNLTFKGLNITEISVGSAWKFFIQDLYIGVNLKLLIGIIGFYRFNIFKNKVNIENSLKDFTKFQKQSIQPAVDLGFMFDKRKSFIKSKFGLVAKNLNRPKFELPDEAKKYSEAEIYLEPKIRAAAAFYPFNFWSISTDVDLLKSPTLLPSYKTQMLSLGTEINILNKPWVNIPLRAGIMKNVACEDKIIYTAGFGLNLLHFVIDIGGSVSSERTKVASDKPAIPSNASVQVTLSLNF
ncbi:MAG: conjugal transfer protein TraF, partial [Elusimicrobiota bacterium]|nr:conjugal transfer protein TraF [Elusimicrobiota bacterium]